MLGIQTQLSHLSSPAAKLLHPDHLTQGLALLLSYSPTPVTACKVSIRLPGHDWKAERTPRRAYVHTESFAAHALSVKPANAASCLPSVRSPQAHGGRATALLQIH